MSDCLFCKIVNGEVPGDIVYQDEQILVFKDIYPKAETHVLLIPKEHHKDLNDLAESNAELLSTMMAKVPPVARQLGIEEGYRTIINTGPGGGQIIFHIHIHILAGSSLPGF